MNITTKKNNLVIEIPLQEENYNPWTGKSEGKVDNIIGIIDGKEMGFCYLINMDYKGKADQHSDFFFKFMGLREQFENLCGELGINCITQDYIRCVGCRTIMLSDLSDYCLDCSQDL